MAHFMATTSDVTAEKTVDVAEGLSVIFKWAVTALRAQIRSL